MRTIEFRPRASVDLDGILVYIALTLKSPQAARNTADAIFAAIERAAELPELGQPFFDEDLDHQGYRRVLVKRYWIYYTYDAHTLTVRRVFHTMQDTDCYGSSCWTTDRIRSTRRSRCDGRKRECKERDTFRNGALSLPRPA